MKHDRRGRKTEKNKKQYERSKTVVNEHTKEKPIAILPLFQSRFNVCSSYAVFHELDFTTSPRASPDSQRAP